MAGIAGGHPSVGPTSGSGGGGSGVVTTIQQFAPVVPEYPPFWLDADDVDGTANTTIANLGAVATALNKGRYRNAGNQVDFNRQAGNITLNKGKYSGRFGNLSTLQSDGTGWMATNNNAVIPALPAVCAIHLAFIMNNLSTTVHQGLVDGVGNRGGGDIEAPSGTINIVGSGGGLIPTTMNVAALQFNILTFNFNGAASNIILNGAQSGNFAPAPVGLTGLTLFSLIGGAFISTMELGTFVFSVNPAMSVAWQNWMRAKYGAFPQ